MYWNHVLHNKNFYFIINTRCEKVVNYIPKFCDCVEICIIGNYFSSLYKVYIIRIKHTYRTTIHDCNSTRSNSYPLYRNYIGKRRNLVEKVHSQKFRVVQKIKGLVCIWNECFRNHRINAFRDLSQDVS